MAEICLWSNSGVSRALKCKINNPLRILWPKSRTNKSYPKYAISSSLESNITIFDQRKATQNYIKSVFLWNYGLGFDSESGRTNDCKIGIHSFPAWRLV